MTRFYARLRTPPQEMSIKVAPSRRGGVRLDLGDRFVYVSNKIAREMADALHDCADKETPND